MNLYKSYDKSPKFLTDLKIITSQIVHLVDYLRVDDLKMVVINLSRSKQFIRGENSVMHLIKIDCQLYYCINKPVTNQQSYIPVLLQLENSLRCKNC